MVSNLSLTNSEIESLNQKFELYTTPEILRWAWERFGMMVGASSSFQTQSVPLLHMIAQICPDMTIIFVDTGFHFSETLHFRDMLKMQFGLNVVNVKPAINKNDFYRQYGYEIYKHDPDLCCHINKVLPMQQAMQSMSAWISGIRRDQTVHRNKSLFLEQQQNGLIKINPMLNWTKKDLWQYMSKHNLPNHPLHEQGYLSIGCKPCTYPVSILDNERLGRWQNNKKTECGLHSGAKKLAFSCQSEL